MLKITVNNPNYQDFYTTDMPISEWVKYLMRHNAGEQSIFTFSDEHQRYVSINVSNFSSVEVEVVKEREE